ncbi:hypothetical protein [Shinella pollutisoli]|uniref:Uncharacterized protein n=1 Tax=Shinella pollutisoli TaxID=2250594 RepID=A0ABV7DCJ4_9HYPH|nr:hypothetical protein [Shinella pollutisoli]
MVRPALIVGSALSVWKDVEDALAMGEFAEVVTCNDTIPNWPGECVVVTFHPEKLIAWLEARDRRGFPKPAALYVKSEWREKQPPNVVREIEALDIIETDYRFPGQTHSGSSGLFCTKVALVNRGHERALCCGVPMSPDAMHIVRQRRWGGAATMQAGWQEAYPVIKDSVRSMSGWTRELLGKPTPDWLLG